ncbi:MAG: hypothetical protein ACR2FY_02705 [Pirellulaceae bacterium]
MADANLQGQIAHVDRDRTNHQESNLAYLCLPHHDVYDSTPSQSKRLSPAELLHAKKALHEFLNRSSDVSECDRLTLTIESDLLKFTNEHQKRRLETIRLDASLRGGIKVVVGILKECNRLTVELATDDAARLCRAFNERRLDEVLDVELTPTPDRSLEINSIFDERMACVSKGEAIEVVRSRDAAVFLLGEREVSYEAAKCGIYTKGFGRKTDRHTTIVITMIDDHQNNHLYAALRLDHRLVRVPDPPNPVQALRAFLDVFGVDLSLPGLGTSRLFLGGRMRVPPSVVTDSDSCLFLTQVVKGQWREPFSMISNTKMSEVGPFINVNLLAFYAQKRYWKAIKK